MASTVARAYNKGLEAEPPSGSKSRALGQGIREAKPPETEALLVVGRSMKAANLPVFLKSGNIKKSTICITFGKNHRWP